jgi:uncharacterized membrane-anchored protein
VTSRPTAQPTTEPAAAQALVRTRAFARTGLVKVPEITIYFWVIKVLTTGMGEATSDYLVHRFPPPLAAAAAAVVLALALAIQFAWPRYQLWVYWFAVVMVSVFGTMAADGLHVELHVPYVESTAFYAVSLAVIFWLWHRTEGTLSIHSITTRRRELFYWATVMATFALGTASGDLTAHTVGLGFLGAGIMFAAIFCIPLVAWRFLGMNAILSFWFAYVVTRPLGASFADWFGVPHSLSGLGYGRGTVAIGLSVLILALVGFLAVTGRDVPRRRARS